jgi:hypothetical protein
MLSGIWLGIAAAAVLVIAEATVVPFVCGLLGLSLRSADPSIPESVRAQVREELRRERQLSAAMTGVIVLLVVWWLQAR